MNTGFQFKQFFVKHDKCAMKVGTDGVLLGAWTPTNPLTINPLTRILDIGTGSGLIALMLAQRCPEAQIDAIDIDPDAVAQARENFTSSPWSARLHVSQCALQEWSNNIKREASNNIKQPTYDLIVSNPPYFTASLKNPDAARCTARHNDTLPFSVLIAESAKLLAPDGTLALIVPTEAEHELQALAEAQGLCCTHRCYVHPKPDRPAKRVLIAWQRPLASAIHGGSTDHLTLEDDHGARSIAYQHLTRDFYL
jgi:tRNA1Val (adenine37-N6)-methyltransferase